MSKFQAGDNVVDIISGQRGKVGLINDGRPYPVRVLFSDPASMVRYYTLEGKRVNSDDVPRLHHEGTTITINEVEPNRLPKLKVDDIIMVREGFAYEWKPAHFHSFTDAGYATAFRAGRSSNTATKLAYPTVTWEQWKLPEDVE